MSNSADSDSNVECKVSNAKWKTEEGRKKKRSPRRYELADSSVFGEKARIPSKRGRWGERPIYISVEEAAARLGWSVKWTKRQIDWGYIEGKWLSEGRRVVLQSVEWWIAAHAEQKARRSEERARKRKGLKVESGVPDTEPWYLQQQELEEQALVREGIEHRKPEEEWISTGDAYRLLGMSKQMVYYLAKTGQIRRKLEGKRARFARSDVVAYIDHRETLQYKRSIPAKDWHYDLKHPFIRKLGEPPKGDRFITVKEAAMILRVCRQTVSARILSGRLFAWQKEVGKRGIPVYLSENQVRRYACRPDRLRRRELWERSMAESAMGQGQLLGWAEKGITLRPPREAGPAAERDFGEYYTQKQVAILFGVSVSAVTRMRKRQRLRGFRKAWKKGRYHLRRWWFYKKEEVHALMTDPEYIKYRDAYRQSQTPEGKAARLARFLKELEYLPHDPANVRFLPFHVRIRDGYFEPKL